MKEKKSFEIDMCTGPLLGKILLFTLPLILSGILQLLFNAADIVVVGRYTGSEALAAVAREMEAAGINALAAQSEARAAALADRF